MNNLNPSNVIALAALSMSVVTFIISLLTNTKRFELSHEQRGEILKWYAETTEVLIKMQLSLRAAPEEKITLLAKLSALIELGRFYFPNVDRDDGYGKEKLSAYRGKRHMCLDFLVFSYDIYKKYDSDRYAQHLLALQQCFTSYIWQTLNPKAYTKAIKKHTGIALNQRIGFEEFISSSPQESPLWQYI